MDMHTGSEVSTRAQHVMYDTQRQEGGVGRDEREADAEAGGGGSGTAQGGSTRQTQGQHEREEQGSGMEQVRRRTEVGSSTQEESGEMAGGGVESVVGSESSGSVEHTAQVAAVTGDIGNEQLTQGGSMSEGESTRLNSEISEKTHRATSGGRSTSGAPPQRGRRRRWMECS